MQRCCEKDTNSIDIKGIIKKHLKYQEWNKSKYLPLLGPLETG